MSEIVGGTREDRAAASLVVSTMFPNGEPAPAGSVRVIDNTPGGHPADGMTAMVSLGDGAYASIINPQSFEDGGPEWQMRYGNPEAVRYTVAALLSSYDYLLGEGINMKEATRRLRLMRTARRALADTTPSQPDTKKEGGR